jgi:hypothetical protein
MSGVSDARRVLILVTSPAVNSEADFAELAGFIAELSSETLVFVLPDADSADTLAQVPDLPTLTVSFGPVRRLRPRRGPLLQGQHIAKSEEYRALAAFDIPVPRWSRLLPGKTPALDGFGPHVVTKPDFGARGADVRLERRELARWARPRTQLGEHFGGPWSPRVAQEFVYTGPWPRSHRVATLFGSALFALRIEADHARQPLPDRASFHGQSIVSSGHGCTFALCAEPEIHGLAERAHAAFPQVPLLGVDIVRDIDTGELFVIEVNSIGYTWHFSSPSGRKLQSQFGLDLDAQFEGRRRAAGVLVRACEKYASLEPRALLR